MGLFKEFINYFLSVMMGKRDSLTSFLEPLTMGERYYHWGLESGDIRDFRAAMDYLHLCNDAEAPMASLLLRKYNCVSDITNAAIERLLHSHDKVIEKAIKTENDYRQEKETLLATIVEAKEKARKLQEEGSLIKAKSEEGRIEELEDSAARLQEMLDSGEGRTEIFTSYDSIYADAQRFFRELDQAVAMLDLPNKLGTSMAGNMGTQLRSRLEYLRSRLDKADPVLTDSVKPVNPASPEAAKKKK
ncbi:MAG: hypothetical protein LBU79_05320 [Planctomycetota bacterium]|jgi:plasmid stabilization system protein ParE|nr:hypothetical protein [Planctomycetota bacterium]